MLVVLLLQFQSCFVVNTGNWCGWKVTFREEWGIIGLYLAEEVVLENMLWAGGAEIIFKNLDKYNDLKVKDSMVETTCLSRRLVSGTEETAQPRHSADLTSKITQRALKHGFFWEKKIRTSKNNGGAAQPVKENRKTIPFLLFPFYFSSQDGGLQPRE